MIKLFKNIKKEQVILITISVILISFQVYLELKMPDYMREVTILVQSEGSKFSDILSNGFYMMLCAFGSLISAIIVGYIISVVAASFSLNIRKILFDKVLNLSMDEVKGFSTSSLITRTTNDITQLQMLLSMGLQIIIKAPITAVWAVTKILNKSWQWSALTAVAVVVLLSVIISLTIIVIPRFKLIQKLTDNLNRVTRENLTGLRVIRAYNAEDYQEKNFESVNSDLTNKQLFNQRAFAMMGPIMYLVLYFLTLGIYYVGAYLIMDANITEKITLFGNMVVFSSYAMQVIMSFLLLTFVFVMVPRAQVSAKRINEVLDKENSIKDGNIEKVNDKDTIIEFKNVSFRYPNATEDVLSNISFKVEKGETIAFIGSTGSGKSTLINLIPRFYDVTSGEILINGVNIKDYKLEALYETLGYVSQKAIIFNGSIIDNVTYGSKEKKLKEVIKAIDIAQARDFVEDMDKKYESHISEGGTNISGGQKQRISIARAIYKKPKILIFDDSFSALDYKTDKALRRSLDKNTKEITSLIVAQRIGTIMNADKIIVLDQGKCVGIGTHKELLSKCNIYKQIALSQLSKEELE